MSNVSKLTPYNTTYVSDSQDSNVSRKWFSKESSELEKLEDELDIPLTVSSLCLLIRNSSSLVQTAKKLGYAAEIISESLASSHDAQELIFLSNQSTGERIIIEQTNTHGIILYTDCDITVLQKLVKEHIVDRAKSHLMKRDFELNIINLSNGEIEILCEEKNSNKIGGVAELKSHIQSNGDSTLDVDKLFGRRCVQISQDFAQAIGCKITNTTLKDSYFQRPNMRLN